MSVAKILNACRKHRTVDKNRIAEITGLSYPTVNNVIRDNTAPTPDPREKKFYFLAEWAEKDTPINPDYAHYVGISVGYSHIKIVVLDFTFSILQDGTIKKIMQEIKGEITDESKDKLCSICVKTPESLIDFTGIINTFLEPLLVIGKHKIQGVGFAFSGFTNPVDNKVSSSFNLDYLEDIRPSDILRSSVEEMMREQEIVCIFEHNAKAVCIAEKELSKKDEENLAVFYFGTGIGSGLVLGNSLIRGNKNKAGQIGHLKTVAALDKNELTDGTYTSKATHHTVPLDENTVCSCGGNGCIEQLIRYYVFGCQTSEDFRNASNRENDKETPIGKLLSLEDSDKKKKLALLTRYVAILISHIINTLSVDTIVLAGWITNLYDEIRPMLKEVAGEYCFTDLLQSCNIRRSALDLYAPAIGAAICANYKDLGIEYRW